MNTKHKCQPKTEHFVHGLAGSLSLTSHKIRSSWFLIAKIRPSGCVTTQSLMEWLRELLQGTEYKYLDSVRSVSASGDHWRTPFNPFTVTRETSAAFSPRITISCD